MTQPAHNILVVDDNLSFLDSIKLIFSNHNIITSANLTDARKNLDDRTSAVLLDLVFDDTCPDNLEGMEFIPYIRGRFPDLPIIIMTNYSSISISVEAIKKGATDFLSKKDLDWTEWKGRIINYCDTHEKISELKKRNYALQQYDETEIIGSSEQINYVKRRLIDLAKYSSDVPIFITGETGTGKNLAVKYFRKYSVRKDLPFIEFSISEISETVLESELFGHVKGAFTGADKNKIGLFEEADGGILFLDEIGDYDLKIQKKIMRFIEDKSISPVGSTQSKKLNIQLIMATNRDISILISQNEFRDDLFQRINKVRIELPPLRNRKEDIRILADYFFHHFRIKERTNLESIENSTYQILENYYWPGNIRELQSVIWDACTRARLDNDKILSVIHLRNEIRNLSVNYSSKIDKNVSLDAKKAMLELETIEKALEKTNGKKTEAAELLGMSLDQMRYKVERALRLDQQLPSHFDYINKYYKNLIKQHI